MHNWPDVESIETDWNGFQFPIWMLPQMAGQWTKYNRLCFTGVAADCTAHKSPRKRALIVF